MNAILKHILRSVSKNKAQAVVIILTIIVVTAMLFISFSVSDLFYNFNMKEYNRVAQDADMLIGTGLWQGETFSRSRVEALLNKKPDGIKSAEYFLTLETILKTDSVSKMILVEATDLSEYLEKHNLNYVEIYGGTTGGVGDVTSEYKPAVIGYSFAKAAGLSAGDTIEVYLSLYDIYAKLMVFYVAADEGIFASASAINILTDFTAISNQGQVNSVYVTFTDSALFTEYEEIFKEYMPNTNVSEGNSETFVKDIARNNTLLFSVALVFIIALMVIIQLTSYLIIARNRTGEMAVFKAAGATPIQVTLIMLAEVVFYGLIGAALGLIAGRLSSELIILYLLGGVKGLITFNIWKYIASALIAVLVSVMACLVPVISSNKRSIRDFSAVSAKETRKEKPLYFIITTVLVVIGSVLLTYLTGVGVIIVSGIIVIVVAAWIYFSLSFIMRFTGDAVAKIKNTGGFGLSTKTVRRNKAVHTITVLLAVVIAFSFIVVEVLGVVKLAITPHRSRYDADYAVISFASMSAAEHDLVRDAIVGTEGISAAGYFNSAGFFYDDETAAFGLNGAKDFWTLEHITSGGLSKGTKERWESEEYPIVFSEDMMLMYGFKVGDSVSLTPSAKEFRDLDFSFVIVGIDYTSTEYDKIGYVGYSDLTMMSKTATYIVKADEKPSDKLHDEVFINLRNTVENMVIGDTVLEKTYALDGEEWILAGKASFSGVLGLFTLLQAVIYFVCFLALSNIMIVTVMDRRHEILLYRLSGMTPSDYMKFSLGESVIACIAGVFIGILVSFLINRFLPVVSALIGKYMSFGIFPLSALTVSAAGAAAFIALWLLISYLKHKVKLSSINERLN